jgi:pentatricopeptide repeat protein
VFPSVLKSCTLLMDLWLGESLHAIIIRLGMDFNLYTGNALMNMYSRFQCLGESGRRRSSAPKRLDGMPDKRRKGKFESGVASCGELGGRIVSEELEGEEGMLYFDGKAKRRIGGGETFNNNNSCNSNELVNKYEEQATGIDHRVNLNQITDKLPQSSGNRGISGHFYGKMNDVSAGRIDVRALLMDNVRKIFDMMPKRDIVSWNTVIAGNAENGLYEEALAMVREMGNANLKPDSFTLSSVLPIFAEYVDVIKGKGVHAYAIRHGFDADLFIGSSLIDMYAKCTRVEDSCWVFNLLSQCDAISWNFIIAGFVQNGLFNEGLRFFRHMLRAKIKPVSFSSIMPACVHLSTLLGEAATWIYN